MMLDEDRAVAPLLASPFNESNPAVPDGAWIAYRSDESGRNEVYVDRFPDLGDRRVQVSTGGGTSPLWSPDGTELYYCRAGPAMIAVPET